MKTHTAEQITLDWKNNDRWNGVERVQLRLTDIAPADARLGIH